VGQWRTPLAEASEDEGRSIGGDAPEHLGLHLLRKRALERDGDARAEVLELARVGLCLADEGREGGGAVRGEARADARRS
jgi:hypothetical protein